MPYLTGQVLTQADIAALFTSGTYTPTLTNMAIGTGGTPLNSAKFTFVGFPAGGVLTVEGKIRFGTTAPTLPGASNETISLPTGYSMIESTVDGALLNSQVSLNDVSAGLIFQGFFVALSATTVTIRVATISGTFVQVNISPIATTPFTWAGGDEIMYRFSCRCTGP